MTSDMLFASVILEVSIQKALDYTIPSELQEKIVKGSLVEVPLRGKLRRGLVIETKTSSQVKHAFPISRLIAQEPPLTAELFELALWMAKYYICPLGRVLKTILPAGVRQQTQQKMQYFIMRGISREEMRALCEELRSKAPQQAKVLDVMLQVRKGILHTELLDLSQAPPSSVKSLVEKGVLLLDIVRTSNSFLANQEYFMVKPKPLRPEQEQALTLITKSLDSNAYSPHLLFGVTGSGKTEVYLQAIEHALQKNKGVIMLVPEISLTEQTIERLRCRIRAPIAVLHHRLSDGERSDAWDKIKNGDLRIAIGARSAIFCPMPNLGLIIVDEEHEMSYKQSDDSPCYQARDVAIFRAKLNNATIVLGSATPSLESYYNAVNGKYTLSKLSDRGNIASLPSVTVVDMKKEYEKAKGLTYLSDPLLSKIKERKERGEQTILFLNRRGFHTVLSCQSCGKSVMCKSCSTKMTFHRSSNQIMCHLCGFETSPPHTCPSCQAHKMFKYQGAGTEKIEAMLHAIFPEIKTLRVDADSTRHKGSLETLLQEFRSGKADVLIGTQMIAKGLHFPEVTLVGVLNCDSTLNIPDFRSQEQVFQLITQVSGRAGRSFSKGEVVLQTALPEHSTIQHGAKQNFEAFFKEELEVRSLFNFPPYCRIVKFLFLGKDEAQVLACANGYSQIVQNNLPNSYFCHPVIPAAHAKVKDFFRYQFLVRGPNIATVRLAIEAAEKKASIPSTISRFIDVDPASTFF